MICLCKVRINRLTEPHGNCIDGKEFEARYDKKYSISVCNSFFKINTRPNTKRVTLSFKSYFIDSKACHILISDFSLKCERKDRANVLPLVLLHLCH